MELDFAGGSPPGWARVKDLIFSGSELYALIGRSRQLVPGMLLVDMARATVVTIPDACRGDTRSS